MVSWVFLLVSLIGAGFTFNASKPHFRGGPLLMPSFFAAWITGELAAHHGVWQLIATAVFLWAGALSAWPGWLGLGVTLCSWIGLARLHAHSRQAADVMQQALRQSFPSGGEPSSAAVADETPAPSRRPGRHLIPFWLFDRGVKVERNIAYAPGDGRAHRLDIYAPRHAVHGAPVLLQLHGGGWVIGDKREQARPLMLHLASRGWVCVTANYRLSPGARFPEHLIDVKRALRWIRDQIRVYGGNPDFVAVTGGSAGGHLAALTALTANDPEYQPGFESCDTRVQACVPLYGVYDFTDRFGHQPYDGMERFLEVLVMQKRRAEDPEAFDRASPMSRVHADAPPFLVIHGTHDTLAPLAEARQFADLLREKSRAPVAYAEIPGATHAFEVFHSIRTDHVVKGIEQFLNQVRNQ